MHGGAQSLVLLGVALGCCGSVCINVGNNLQGKGHHENRPRMRQAGNIVFACGSVLVFAAFAFAPASIVAPLESLQFVVNIAFQRVVNSVRISARCAAGTMLILAGTVIAVVAGPKDRDMVLSLATLEGLWGAPGWIVFVFFAIVVAALAEDARIRVRGAPLLEPLGFAMASSLIGPQMQVQSKSVAEAIKLSAAGHAEAVWTSWFPYASLVLLLGAAVFWLRRLNEGLASYDPSLIIPLLQAQFILYATLSGGIFFQEFASMSYTQAVVFALGIVCELFGLLLIVSPTVRSKPDALAATNSLELRGTPDKEILTVREVVDSTGSMALVPPGPKSDNV